MNTLQSFAPLKRVCSKYSRRPIPWISDTNLEKIKLKHKLKHATERSGDADDRSLYKKCKNKLKADICQAKIDYLQSSVLQCKGCPKRAADMWSRIKNVIGRSSHDSATNDKISPDLINDFFQNVAISL